MLINSLLKNKPQIFSETMGEDIIHLGAITFRIPDSVNYSVYKVSKDHIARPDLISQIFYGTDIYGDFICKVNGISNPFEINEGDIIVVPDLTSKDQFMFTDFYDDTITENDRVTTPVPKKKNEKRKANEAIIGDTRFKIDKDRRLIIY